MNNWFPAQVDCMGLCKCACLVCCIGGGGCVPMLALHYVVGDASFVLLLPDECGICIVYHACPLV